MSVCLSVCLKRSCLVDPSDQDLVGPAVDVSGRFPAEFEDPFPSISSLDDLNPNEGEDPPYEQVR